MSPVTPTPDQPPARCGVMNLANDWERCQLAAGHTQAHLVAEGAGVRWWVGGLNPSTALCEPVPPAILAGLPWAVSRG